MKYIANKVNFLCVLIFLVVVDFPAVECEVVLQSISATVGAQNFTYYRLSRRGRIRLELLSPEGDADIYVSDKTLKPSFENYELESVTCGMDQVEIPAAFRRPVGVAIYGYPIHFSSSYHLTIILVSEWDEYDEYEALNSESSEKITKRTAPPKKEIFTEVETDSLIWTVFIGILKIIFDILL